LCGWGGWGLAEGDKLVLFITGGVDIVLGTCCLVLRGGRGGGTTGQEVWCRTARVAGGVRTAGGGVWRDLAGERNSCEWLELMVGESGDLCGVSRSSSTVGVPGGQSLAQTRPPGGEEGGAVRGGEGGGEGGVERGSESSGVTSNSGVSHTVPLLESLLRIPESGLPQRELSPLFLLSDPLLSSPSIVTAIIAVSNVLMKLSGKYLYACTSTSLPLSPLLCTSTSAVVSDTVVIPDIQEMSRGLSTAWFMLLRNTLVLPR